jgi:hypothetical protein
MEEAIESFGDAADQLAEVLDDPAEVVAASVRHAVAQAAADEAWGWFLVRTALARGRGRGLGRRMARDIAIGLEARRFQVDDRRTATLAAGGAVLAIIAGRLHGEIGDDAGVRAAVIVLRMLGVPDAEARRISRRVLPPIRERRNK